MTTNYSLVNTRPVPGFPQYYVSISGDVLSARRGTRLKPQLDEKGYLEVQLARKGKKAKKCRVNRLVYAAFYADVLLQRGDQIHHSNGDNQDNQLSNLVRVSALEHNILHSVESGAEHSCSVPLIGFIASLRHARRPWRLRTKTGKLRTEWFCCPEDAVTRLADQIGQMGLQPFVEDVLANACRIFLANAVLGEDAAQLQGSFAVSDRASFFRRMHIGNE